MELTGLGRSAIRQAARLAILLVSCSGWAQEALPVPRPLPFAENQYGIASPFRERFRAVGWNEKGILAYVTISPARQPCKNCTIFRFVVQDLITDEVVASITGETADSSEPAFLTWWQSAEKEIGQLLSLHRIDVKAQYGFVEGGRIEKTGTEYTFQIAAWPGIGTEGRSGTEFKALQGVQVIAVSEQRGWKRIFAAVPERSIDLFTQAQVVAVLTSPFESRVGVVLALGNIEDSAPAVTVVGSHLDVGFTAGIPKLPPDYTLVGAVATPSTVADAVAQAGTIHERRDLLEKVNDLMAAVQSRDSSSFARFVSTADGLYIVSTPGAAHEYRHESAPVPAHADVGVYSATLENVKSISGFKGVLSQSHKSGAGQRPSGSELERIQEVENSVRWIVTLGQSRLLFAWLQDSWRLIIVDERDFDDA